MWKRTLVAIADKGFRHCLFHLPSDVKPLFHSCLLACFGNMSFQVTNAAACDHAVGLSALKVLVSSHWWVLFCIRTEGAFDKIRQLDQLEILLLLNSIKRRDQ
jgi:hypothetical protein